MKETEELKKTADTLKELGNDWRENMAVLNDATNDNGGTLLAIRRLCRENRKGALIEIGLACIAFPEPIVSDILGSLLISIGLVQRRMKKSALYIEDVNKNLPHLFKDLKEIRQQVV